MKKLMITASIVCVAVLAHAASCNWAADPVVIPGAGIDPDGADQYALIESGSYWLVALGTSGQTSDISVNSSGEIVFRDGSGLSSYYGAAKVVEDATMIGGSIDDTAAGARWALVVYDGDKLFDVFASTVVGGTDQPPVPGDMGFSGTTHWEWADANVNVLTQTVPEPTSGLLLLLGVAGLALKRKRA